MSDDSQADMENEVETNEEDREANEEESEKPKKKIAKYPKKTYPQKFRKEWLTDPVLWYWIVEVPKVDGGSGAECKFCHQYLNVKLCDLKNHALTKKHLNNVKKAPKQQLRIRPPPVVDRARNAHDLTQVDGFNHSGSEFRAQQCEFVVQQSDAHPNEFSSNQTIKISIPSDSAASENYDFGDLIKFDINGVSDRSNSTRPQCSNPWPFLEEEYFVFAGTSDKNKINNMIFQCKLCSPKSTVKTKMNRLFTLKDHVKKKHPSYWDDFMSCIKTNKAEASTLPRMKKSNPWPYLEEKYYMFTGAVGQNKLTFNCLLCSPMKNIKGTRTSMHNLKGHIKNRHPSEWDEFQSCVKANAKPGRPKNSDIELHDPDYATGRPKNSDIEPHDPDSQLHIKFPKTRGRKLELNISDDEDLYDDDVADPDFEPRDPDSPPHDPDSPDEDLMDGHPTNRKYHDSPDRGNVPPTNRTQFRPAVLQASKGSDLSRFIPLFDRVLVQKEEAFTQILTKDGFLIPPQNNTAKVVAVGTGIRSDSGEMIPLEVSVGDEVMIPDYGATRVELDGIEYLLYRDSDLLAKFKPHPGIHVSHL